MTVKNLNICKMNEVLTFLCYHRIILFSIQVAMSKLKFVYFNCFMKITNSLLKHWPYQGQTGPVWFNPLIFRGFSTFDVIDFSILSWCLSKLSQLILWKTKTVSKENHYFNFGSEGVKDNSIPIWLWFLCFFWRSLFLRSLPRTLAQFDYYKIYHWETKLQWCLFN